MARRLWGACAIVVAIACASCGNDDKQASPGNDASVEVGETGAGLSSCLDRPTDPPPSPTSGLPCDLIPPGLTL